MKFDRVLTIRVSKEQEDRLKFYAAQKKKEQTLLIRDFINNIGKSSEEIKKDIEFYQYTISVLEKQLKLVLEKEAEEQKSEEKREREQQRIIEHQKKIKRIKKIEQPILTEINNKFPDYNELVGEDKGKADEIIISIIVKKLVGITYDDKVELVDFIISDLNKYYFNAKKIDLKNYKENVLQCLHKSIQCNTVKISKGNKGKKKKKEKPVLQ